MEHELRSMALDAQGHIWLAALLDLVVEYDPGEQEWQPVQSLHAHVGEYSSPSPIWGMAADRQPGHLWIAADMIVEVEGDTWRIHQPEYRANAVFVDAEGYK